MEDGVELRQPIPSEALPLKGRVYRHAFVAVRKAGTTRR
jgi:hypothetical protein